MGPKPVPALDINHDDIAIFLLAEAPINRARTIVVEH